MSSFDRRQADASYRPKGYGLSPSLQRARAPFRTRNALTGLAMAAFATGVWAYSISAVKQENFDDVDAEALNVSAEEKAKRMSIEDEERAKTMERNVVATAKPTEPPITSAIPSSAPVASSKGVLGHTLGPRFGILHPTQGTLVWGAPSVDRVGSIRDRKGGDGW